MTGKTEQKNITIYELQALVHRCFEEAEKAGFIKAYQTAAPPGVEVSEHAVGYTLKAITNKDELVKHISRTIVGELYELELIRRIAPIFREVKRLTSDFEFLDVKEQERINISGLRIAPNQG